jgi:uncharacterized membrane protein YhaH (DUF805 family)
MTDVSGEWYYALGGDRQGPVAAEELRRGVREGVIGRTVLVWSKGLADWIPYSESPVCGAEVRDEPDGLPPLPLVAGLPGASQASRTEAQTRQGAVQSPAMPRGVAIVHPARHAAEIRLAGKPTGRPMRFGAAIGHCLWHYLSFSGRASRSEYWFFILFGILASFAAGFVDGGFLATPADQFGPVSVSVTLGLILPSWSVAVRRLHDTDRSGWWLLISLVPLIGAIVLLVFNVSPGTQGRNRFA